MHVLCVCRQGQNRSKYLAEYLGAKGYVTKFGGSSATGANPVTQAQVDWADLIITVRDPIKQELIGRFPTKKRIIGLNVYDAPERYGAKAVEMKLAHPYEYQERYVYSELRKQVDKYLPLK